MLCWPLDSKDSTRWHHDIFMTSWHSPDWFLRKKNRGWWLVTCIFPWYDPYHPWSSGVFSASTCLKRCDWLKRPEQSQEAVQCSSSLSDVMLPLPWRNSVCFFLGRTSVTMKYAKSFVWVWTFKLAKMQISWFSQNSIFHAIQRSAFGYSISVKVFLSSVDPEQIIYSNVYTYMIIYIYIS